MDPDYFNRALRGNDRRILALDPGETTGWATFEGQAMVNSGQIKGPTLFDCYRQIRALIDLTDPHDLVMENYKIYAWKAKDHSWSELFTPKLIGAIECLMAERDCVVKMQMAQQAKGFCTDDRLKLFGFWPDGKHARDAVRHAVYYLLFSVARVQERTNNEPAEEAQSDGDSA